MTLPTRDELAALAEDASRGAVSSSRARRDTATSPVNGEVLSSLAYADAAAVDDAVQRARTRSWPGARCRRRPAARS